MSNVSHGVNANKTDSGVITPAKVDTGLHFVVGTAPVHMVDGKVNEVIMASSYKEAVTALGYSDNWKQYSLCEEIYTAFTLFNVSPVFFVNVLDPKKHKKAVAAEKHTVVDNQIILPLEAIASSVKIDGKEIKNVTLESLRCQMGIMTQDNFLFTGTIKDNIRYGRLDATDEEIVAAAKAVKAHDFIMKLENGYDTMLTERGGGLSIGQKQLLAFARTMVSKPAILILDEATSSIDTQTEKLVQQGIEELLRDRTSFVIAHRLSTIQKADRIFVIEDGRIIEEGNVTELLALKGAYYRLHMAQAI